MKRNLGVKLAFAAALGLALAASASARVATTTPDPALAAVFAGASLLQADLMPKPTLKCGLVCLNLPTHTSATISATGATCNAAVTSLYTQLGDIATNDCVNVRHTDGTCNVLVHAMPCTPFGTGYKAQGYVTYSCSVNTC
jgi:hypothetical protein